MWTLYILLFIALLGAVYCSPQGRIVNGTTTTIEKYPFMVSLRDPTGFHLCGASIIAPRWILTAAHCTSGRKPSSINIQYGSTTIDAKGANVAKVKRIIMHENFAPAKANANDIALLELTDQLVYNYKTIAPVMLPEPNFEVTQGANGEPGILTGWGINATGGPSMKHLQEVKLKIYSDEECNSRHYGSTSGDHICGGVDEGGKGQCSGDSGGPLLYKGSIQLGIVSWSVKPCTIAPYPGVFTKVSHYIGWIHKNIDLAIF